MAKKEVFQAIATLVGTVIGAGVLGIPYVVASAGLLTGILVLLFVGFAVTLMYLFYGEVVLRTKGNHQLTGYAEIYLGKYGKLFAMISMVVGIYGALVAYLIGAGASLSAIFGGSATHFSIIFFVFVASLIYVGIKAIKKSELLLIILTIGVLLLISVLSVDKIQAVNLTGFSFNNILAPYGVIIFAFMGTAAIPEMKEILAKNKKQFKKSLLIGISIPLILYIVFTIVIVGVVGINGFLELGEGEKIATIALGKHVGPHLALLGNIFAVLAMTTSFLTLGLALKEMFIYDYKLKKSVAWILTCSVPLIISLFGFASFVEVIGFTGALTSAISICLIVFMFWEAKKKGDRKPEYTINVNKLVGFALMLVLLVGATYSLLKIV